MALRVGPFNAISALHRGDGYERHLPEETVLYRVVRPYWDSFRECVEATGSVPVNKELGEIVLTEEDEGAVVVVAVVVVVLG